MERTIVDYLHALVRSNGSDLHLSVGLPPSLRVAGELRPLIADALTEDDIYALLMSVLTDSQRGKLEENLELDFAININDVGRFRGNAHYIRGAVEATFRHILEVIPSLEQLGHKRIIKQLCNVKDGLVLVTGVTGSGKSSTLAAMINLISQQKKGVIITVEDPIEFVFSHGNCAVKQREVGTDTHSFAAALKYAMRQDPDVIMVSELRDMETIQAAISAAETGHLVLGTLHTIDAPRSLDRLIDVFPPNQQSQIIAQLANCLRAVVSQRLVKTSKSDNRVLVEEVMIVNHPIRSCIRDRKFEQIDSLIELGAKDGMFTIDHHLCELIRKGKITVDEAYENSRDNTVIDSYLEEKKRREEGQEAG
ncbi:MAG: twitching motility protein PilT [Cryomorphaceae bacterium]|jgi:twitching motility protein PilT